MNLHTIVECPRVLSRSSPLASSRSPAHTRLPSRSNSLSQLATAHRRSSIANFPISRVLSNSSVRWRSLRSSNLTSNSLSMFHVFRIHRHIQTPASPFLFKNSSLQTTLLRNARPKNSLSSLWCYANDSCAGTNLSARLLLPLRTLAAAYLSRSPSWGPYSGPYYRFCRPLPSSSFLTRQATLSISNSRRVSTFFRQFVRPTDQRIAEDRDRDNASKYACSQPEPMACGGL